MTIPDNLKNIFNKLKLEQKSSEDNDQRFISQENGQEELIENENNEIKESNIFPKNNQVRDLDNEVGGLETKKTKKKPSEDIWDDRSEIVDEMGSTNVFETSGMRSVVWKKKRKRIKQDKLEEAYDSMSYTDKLKNLREDKSGAFHNHKEGGGSGFSRF